MSTNDDKDTLAHHRYRIDAELGKGGMAQVFRVWDTKMQRPLAMKVQLASTVGHPRTKARFIEESRVTARLEHPGVVPVHDQGTLPDGRLWFTMHEVRGKTLETVIKEVHEASGGSSWGVTGDGWTLHRLMETFATVCNVLAYAHNNQIVHRDLKPANVMVGDFGEVLVLDWGVARILEEPEPLPDSGQHCQPDLALTRDGTVIGTPHYMSPEQAMGDIDAHSPQSDIYSLGVILYHLLTGTQPYEASEEVVKEVVTLVRMGPPPPLMSWVGPAHPQPPPELVELCDKMMAREPTDRPSSLEEVVVQVHRFLDGARRREAAIEALEEARQMPTGRKHREEARRLLKRVEELRESLPADHTEVDANEYWALEDRAGELMLEAETAEMTYIQQLNTALNHQPDLVAGHQLLADLYREHLDHAERTNDGLAATRYIALLRTHDRGKHRSWLEGTGALTLHTDPPNATADLYHFEALHRRLRPVLQSHLGQTPLVKHPLEPGSYLIRLRAAGCSQIQVPIHIRRMEHWDGVPPDGTRSAAIRLPREGELGPDDRFVAGGWFHSGGHDAALDALDARRYWVDSMVVRRFPVTNEEYLEFLNDLVTSGREHEALQHAPSQGPNGAEQATQLFARDTEGRFQLDATSELPWHMDWPIVQIDWHGATAYADWLAHKTGRPWRLLHDQEWEKAARGVDGRLNPWGDAASPLWCCMQTSHSSAPERTSVHAYEADESVYGIRGTAGNTRDWCLNEYERKPPPTMRIVIERPEDTNTSHRFIRGGSFGSAQATCWLAGRFAARPHLRGSVFGFRLAYSGSSMM